MDLGEKHVMRGIAEPASEIENTNGQPASELAYQLIRRDVILGKLPPGAQVTNPEVAKRYGVGPVAVRSALSRLVNERLVQVTPRQGYTIAPLTLKSMHDIFNTRLLLEPTAAGLAAQNVTARQLERLAQLSQAQSTPGDSQSVERYLAATTEFHGLIAEASGNECLADLIKSLFDRVERLLYLGHMLRDEGSLTTSEHHALVEILKAGDADEAERLMADHIEGARRFVINALMTSATLQSVNLVVL
jgi:DNA-binding GntR family transcriptional regulator